MVMWNFRPSSFCSVTNYADLNARTLIGQYIRDNKRASDDDGVTILPRSPNALIRTAQWNVHGWTTALNDGHQGIVKGFMDTIFDADADVIVLNEYYFCGPRAEHHKDFERILREKGYHFFRCGTVSFPTAVATRLSVFESHEILLSPSRSAILLLVGAPAGRSGNTTASGESCSSSVDEPSEQEKVWVIGTHLDHHRGNERQREMTTLLNYMTKSRRVLDVCDRAILMGDFNQQRREDYKTSEWKQIAESMEKRGVVEDDGVSTMLHKMYFTCAWDFFLTGESPECTCTNWETSRPPSTHWTGSIVDYSYGRKVSAMAASISPAGWSDHRMTVCDWTW